jgi:hypothetical protein
MCDLKTSRMSRPWPALWRTATNKNNNLRSIGFPPVLQSWSSRNARSTYVASRLTGPTDRPLTTCYSTHRQVILVSEWEECTYAGVVAAVISVARARQGLRKPRPLDVPCTHDRYSTQTRFRATVNQMVFDYGSIKFRVRILGRMCFEGAKGY